MIMVYLKLLLALGVIKMYNNIINNKKNRIRLMRRVVLFIRDIGIFKTSITNNKRKNNITLMSLAVYNQSNISYLNFSNHGWASNITVNVLGRRPRYPSANLGSSTATIELFGGKYG